MKCDSQDEGTWTHTAKVQFKSGTFTKGIVGKNVNEKKK